MEISLAIWVSNLGSVYLVGFFFITFTLLFDYALISGS